MPASDNKRIARNAAALYVRMLLSMAVTLYTSRVVLRVLGVDDFGIYGVVAGLSGMMVVVGNSIVMAIQRQIAYEAGRPDGNVSNALSASLHITLLASAITVLLAETIGLWFVNVKMVFPPGSMTAVNWTYQLAILSSVLSLIRCPYNALVLAYERMSFYAYSSIVEVVLKLLIVYLLLLSPASKLITYSALSCGVVLLINIWYIAFCRKKFPSVKAGRVTDRTAYRDIAGISGWSLFGAVANVGYMQGVNVLINLFWGVAVNAAVSIANQVNSAVMQFVFNIQTAFNPQLIKTHANGERQRQHSLIEKSAKFSALVMMLICFPLIMNMDGVLRLWLGEYPAQTVAICNMIMIAAVFEVCSNSMMVSIFATGHVRSYQIAISLLLLLNLPIDYLFARSGCQAWVLYLVRAVIYLGCALLRLYYCRRLIDLRPLRFCRRVYLPVFTIGLLFLAVGYGFRQLYTPATGFLPILSQTLILILVGTVIISTVGLTSSERNLIINAIKSKLKK